MSEFRLGELDVIQALLSLPDDDMTIADVRDWLHAGEGLAESSEEDDAVEELSW